jgi:diguanylate cyclase (GGDEF)-like protein
MRAAASVVGHPTRQRAANAVVRAAVRLVGAPRAVVFLDPHLIGAHAAMPPTPARPPTELFLLASVGQPRLRAGYARAVADGWLGDVLRPRRASAGIHRREIAVASAGAPASPWPGLPHAVAVPLKSGRLVVGVLVVGISLPSEVDASRLAALSGFAKVAGAGLVTAIRHEEAARLAVADPLTGLLNRAGFDRRLREELDRDHRAGAVPGALVMMDLDRFKYVNDTWGHLSGDAVVRVIARFAIRAQVRSYDVPCRIGGDEFAVILPHTNLDDAVAVAERISRGVANAPTETVGVPRGTIGASLGVVSFVAGGVGPDEILARADQIMYRAKRRGRNVVLADDITSYRDGYTA